MGEVFSVSVTGRICVPNLLSRFWICESKGPQDDSSPRSNKIISFTLFLITWYRPFIVTSSNTLAVTKFEILELNICFLFFYLRGEGKGGRPSLWLLIFFLYKFLWDHIPSRYK